MRATGKDAVALAGLVKIVWPEHTEEALTRIILEYMDSDVSELSFTDQFSGAEPDHLL